MDERRAFLTLAAATIVFVALLVVGFTIWAPALLASAAFAFSFIAWTGYND